MKRCCKHRIQNLLIEIEIKHNANIKYKNKLIKLYVCIFIFLYVHTFDLHVHIDHLYVALLNPNFLFWSLNENSCSNKYLLGGGFFDNNHV